MNDTTPRPAASATAVLDHVRSHGHLIVPLGNGEPVALLDTIEAAAAAGEIPAPAAPSTNPPVFMAPTPLFHVTACNCVLHPATASGAKIVLMYKWDAGRALELIERLQTDQSQETTVIRASIAHHLRQLINEILVFPGGWKIGRRSVEARRTRRVLSAFLGHRVPAVPKSPRLSFHRG